MFIKIKKNKPILITMGIIIMILLIILLMPKTLAKYTSTDKIMGNMDIAKPIFYVEGKETTKINSINDIGYYEFSVKNYDDDQISDVDFEYTIEVVSKTDDFIKFELYKNEQKIELKDLKTDVMSIKGNEQTEEKYKLKVMYDESKGTISSVNDDEIMTAYKLIANCEGVLAEPASAASVAGLIKCRHTIKTGAKCVCILTGNGLKDPDNAIKYSGAEVKKTSADIKDILNVMSF